MLNISAKGLATVVMNKRANKQVSEERAKEWWKCARNPLYFIFNYVSIPKYFGTLYSDVYRIIS